MAQGYHPCHQWLGLASLVVLMKCYVPEFVSDALLAVQRFDFANSECSAWFWSFERYKQPDEYQADYTSTEIVEAA